MAKTKKVAKKAEPKAAATVRKERRETGDIVLLSPETLRAIGHAANGTHWAADMADACFVSKSYVSRVLDQTRTPDTGFAQSVQRFMIHRIKGIGELLSAPGLPQGPRLAKAQALIAQAVHEMQKDDPHYKGP